MSLQQVMINSFLTFYTEIYCSQNTYHVKTKFNEQLTGLQLFNNVIAIIYSLRTVQIQNNKNIVLPTRTYLTDKGIFEILLRQYLISWKVIHSRLF